MRAIAEVTASDDASLTLLSLLFAPGHRPRASDIEALAASGGGFAISHRPDDAAGWLELLVNGLTFDLRGHSPTPPAAFPRDLESTRHLDGEALAALEPISLAPGPHLAGAEAMLPVVRAAAGLGARLSRLKGVKAVCWHPAPQAAVDVAEAFAAPVEQWLDGGPFPALTLTGLIPEAASSPYTGFRSIGLKFLTGQELLVEARDGASQADAAKLAVRLIDRLVAAGAVDQPAEIDLSPEDRVRLEPDPAAGLVRAWRVPR